MSDYCQEAFGRFDPQDDSDAAVKFVLSILVMDSRFDELGDLLTDGHDLGALEGDPGWIVERRDSGPTGTMPGYASWPEGKTFRAFVDPSSFELGYPEVFVDASVFRGYVCQLMDACLQADPGNVGAQRIRAMVQLHKLNNM